VNATEAFPLCWPANRPRTSQWSRERARFDITFARARDEIVRQIELMTGKYDWNRRETGLIISTNIALRRDGLPLAGQRQQEDPGVAVYFNYKKRQMCFACDRWQKVEDNMQAIAKTIDALRGIARWGTGDMLEAAFTGFAALAPPTTTRTWREVFGYLPGVQPSAGDLEQRYRVRISQAHPDRGGSVDAAAELNAARDAARKELGF